MRHPMRCLTFLAVLLASALWALAGTFPEPSPYPISWEITFRHGPPKRIVVAVPGQHSPQAYWYVTYNVTNNSDQEQTFLPLFELVNNDGTVLRSDNNISPTVFEKIKQREGSRFLEPANKIAGTLRIGEDQTRDGVAIWPEPMARMGRFSIFVTGLSGEFTEIKGADGKAVMVDGQPLILRKTFQIDYQINGDDVTPGDDQVHFQAEKWVMR